MERMEKQNGKTENTQHTTQAKFDAQSGDSQLSQRLYNSPAMVAQRKKFANLFGATAGLSPVQFTVDAALHEFDDAVSGKQTPTKVIKTKTLGGPFVYKFAKSGEVIDSFSNNIATDKEFESKKISPGPNPVKHSVDILNESNSVEEVAEDSRPKHFRAADKLAGLGRGARTNKLTWHHKLTPCKLETVDMNVHGVMSHYGGFSQWKGESVSEVDED